MSEGLSAIFWGVITFSFLVVIHEGGHFLAARLFGVKVHEFMIGLPGPAIRFHGKKTAYGITAFPLGGYVRIAGMEPGPENPLLASALSVVTRAGTMNVMQVAEGMGVSESEADEALVTLADWGAIEQTADEHTYRSLFPSERADHPRRLLDEARSSTYRGLSFGKRIAVLCMGVVFNLITAILVFTVVLSAFGYYKETGRVGSVNESSAAAQAGIVEGDRVVSVGGRETPDFQRLTMAVGRHEAGDTVVVVYEHDGNTKRATVEMGENPRTKRAMLGVGPDYVFDKPNVFEAFGLSFLYIGLTFQAILGFFNPATFQVSVSQSSSVIGAAVATAQAVKSGPLDYAYLVAALSLSLGAINIFPIPPLDGGKIVVEAVERLRGKPLPRNLSLGLSVAGALLLFALVGYLMYADVIRLIGS